VISRFFIDRPIFASVLSIIITLAGGVAVFNLPIAQYPDVTPPTVVVTASYPGANCLTLQDTVAAPIEEQVSGVEGMMYMSSQCTNDGTYTLTVTFQLGTSSDVAQVLVQNRVSLATPVIPAIVQREGITVKKQSPNTLMIVNLTSRGVLYRDLQLSNYATIEIRDELGRLPGVAGIGYLGQRDYSMRIWLNPDRLAALNLTASDVVTAISQQNEQVAAGQIGQEPVPRGQQFQLTINTRGRLVDPDEFGNIVLKAGTPSATPSTPLAASPTPGAAVGSGGTAALGPQSGTPNPAGSPGESSMAAGPSQAIVLLKDVARIELGAQQYDQSATLDDEPTVALTVYGLPGANAIDTAEGIYKKMEELKKRFPQGMEYRIVYDTTPFIRDSVNQVFKTLRDAIILVALVVLVFLQNWRASIIPLAAVPVAIIGTFAVMAALHFSLNNLSLFGLVLAIGIVVDDAIVVVENVERWLEKGLDPKEATRRAMDEVTGPVIAIALVLTAVFIPCAFIGGIIGQFFRQFAVTIAVSTLISAFNSLTLSPALAAILLQKHDSKRDIVTRGLNLVLGWFFKLFNMGFENGANLYAAAVGRLLRISLVVLLIYGGLLFLTYDMFTGTPTGFVPQQDKGYLLLNIQLPDSASVERTQRIMSHIETLAKSIPGVQHTVGISGQSLILNANAPNLGSMYVILDPFDKRTSSDQSADAIAKTIQDRCWNEVRGASVTAFGAPPVEGLGTTGGFKMIIEDRGNLGLGDLQRVSEGVMRAGNKTPGLEGLFNSSRFNTPWVYLQIDRTKCVALGVTMEDVFNTLQYNLGSYYVNNFNEFGRNWQVNIQDDPKFRARVRDVKRLQVRNKQGDMFPLSTVLSIQDTSGPVLVLRYNMYSAAAITGSAAPGTSSGEAAAIMEQIARNEMMTSMAIDWTELMYLQNQAGNTALYAFALAVVFVFLVLAAQYESWKLPFAVILVVPMCLLCSVIGVKLTGQSITIFVQIGLIVLVGLASKNAILIVEFAKQQQEEGVPRYQAAVEASRLRLRPILMTSFAFIFGVIPLIVATGAGAEMRQSLGVAVFSGMLGVTLFGVFLTPIFFDLVQRIGWNTPPTNPDHGQIQKTNDPHGQKPETMTKTDQDKHTTPAENNQDGNVKPIGKEGTAPSDSTTSETDHPRP
jgi:hydrophobe/amphiphile efflux-1 (HAE1) family protein